MENLVWYIRNIKVSSKILKKLAEINYLKVWKQLSQAAAEDDGEAGPGARRPRPSPGPPGSRHGQPGASGPEGCGPALWGHQQCWQLLQKDTEVPGLSLQADEHQPLWGPRPLPSPQTHLWQTVQGRRPTRLSVAQPLGHLKVFDGIPPPYEKKKPMVVPTALKAVRLKPIPKFAYT